VAATVEEIAEKRVQSNVAASAGILAGLLLKRDVIPCQGIAFGFLKWEKGRSSLPTGETHDQTDVYGRRH
jgi:hypothetical protein